MTKSPAGVRTKIQQEHLEKRYRLKDKSTGCHGAEECPVSVHFLSNHGWHSLGQTTGSIFEQRLPPFLHPGKIRYSKHVSNSVTLTRQGHRLSCCIAQIIYTHTHTGRHPLSFSLFRCGSRQISLKQTCRFLGQSRGDTHVKSAHKRI